MTRVALIAGQLRRSTLSVRRLVTIVALTLAWCGLWQTLSIANVLSGIAISLIVLSSGVGTTGRGGVRVLPLLHLLWVVFVDLVVSTIDVAKEVATPGDSTQEAIIAVEIPSHARHHLLLLIVAVTLTPGTAVVDADPDTGTLYLHLLKYGQADSIRSHVAKIAELADQALPISSRTTNGVSP